MIYTNTNDTLMLSSSLKIAGKARPGLQTTQLKRAGFTLYEAVIAEREDWRALEIEAEQGLFAISVDIKGKEKEARRKELPERVSLLENIGKDNYLGCVYVEASAFPKNIEWLANLKYPYKAIEVLPATSPAALEANASYPQDLIRNASAAEVRILVDICHLFQTGVYEQAKRKPLTVTKNSDGTFTTEIPKEATNWYHQAFEEIAFSGYLAPFVHNNGHIFVTDQDKPKEGEKDQRVKLLDGRILQAYGDNPLTLADWGDGELYNYYSWAVPISIGGERKIAQWFRSHTFITDPEKDEIYTVLNPKKVVEQLVRHKVKIMVLENNKESAEKLRRDANFFTKYL